MNIHDKIKMKLSSSSWIVFLQHCRWCKRDSFSCWEASFLDRFCALFPRVTIKTVRLPLSALVPLLQVRPLYACLPSPQVVRTLSQVGLVDRVLLVVRDPRGALVSRYFLNSVLMHLKCANPLQSDASNDCGSRRKLWWCDSPDCTEANRHCNDLEAAFHKFKSESAASQFHLQKLIWVFFQS